MPLDIEKRSLQELSYALSRADDAALIQQFLVSLLTKAEVSEVALRWALVRLIEQGVSQRKIAQDLGLSLCKITRGSKELKKPGSPFKKMIDIFKENEEALSSPAMR